MTCPNAIIQRAKGFQNEARAPGAALRSKLSALIASLR